MPAKERKPAAKTPPARPARLKDFCRKPARTRMRPVPKKDDVIIAGMSNIAYAYAKCCQPVPGDDVIGFVTAEGMVKIHRKNCLNVSNENLLKSERIVSVAWNRKVETTSSPA